MAVHGREIIPLNMLYRRPQPVFGNQASNFMDQLAFMPVSARTHISGTFFFLFSELIEETGP